MCTRDTQNDILEKAKWVEEQTNRTLGFHLESSEILRGETHTTLGWLYLIIIGTAGFVISHTSKNLLWLTVPLGICSVAAGIVAIVFLSRAMMTKQFPSPGNVPSNIGTAQNLALPEDVMRLQEARGIEETIRELATINAETAAAINNARIAVAVIPGFTLCLIGLCCLFFS